MKNHISKAIVFDLPDVFNIFERCKQKLLSLGIDQWDDLYPGEFPRKDIEIGSMYKYMYDKKIIGVIRIDEIPEKEYGQVVWEDINGRALVVHRLVVDPKHQDRGIASKLMDFVEKYAISNGYSSIRLDAYCGNPVALNLYVKRDYRKAGEVFFPRRKLAFKCFEKIMNVAKI